MSAAAASCRASSGARTSASGTRGCRVGTLLVNQLLGPPIGALLFGLGMALPFVVDALCFALGALLVSRIVLDRGPGVTLPRPRADAAPVLAGWRAEMAAGLRWLAGNPPMRTLALTIFAFNVTFGAAWAVLVLYAQERLGVGDLGFGLLMTAMAVGGLVGTSAYGRLERRFSLADIMRVGLLIETGTHLVLALTTSAAVALVTFVLFGAHAYVWNTTSTVVRQRAVPDKLLGRVTGVYIVGAMAGIVIGTPIGGLLARTYGITAPFWFGFFGSAAASRHSLAPVRQHRPRRRPAPRCHRAAHRCPGTLAAGSRSRLHAVHRQGVLRGRPQRAHPDLQRLGHGVALARRVQVGLPDRQDEHGP